MLLPYYHVVLENNHGNLGFNASRGNQGHIDYLDYHMVRHVA